jgi:hypothetical protein
VALSADDGGSHVDTPQRRVYELTQEELNTFVEGYEEFAEFMIASEKLQ